MRVIPCLRHRWGLWLATTLGLAAYAGMVALDIRTGTLRASFTSQTIVWYLLAFVGFLVAVWWNERRRIPLLWLWSVPIAFRLVLLATTPTLSDDVYRYLWDGHVATEGVNPYRYAIDAPELDQHEIPARNLANNPSLATPYLPTAQLVFAASAWVLPSEPLVMQTVMVAFDLLLAVVLTRLLGIAGLPRRRIMLYLWNPLVIVEVAHGAHLDALMVFLAMAAVLLTLKSPSRRAGWAGPIVLALATLTRLLPALLVPVLWWRWNWPQRLLYGAAAVAVLLPFGLGAGWGLSGEATGTGLFGAARVYSQEFVFNSGIYHWLEGWIGRQGADDPAATARLVVVGLLAGVLVLVLMRARASSSRGSSAAQSSAPGNSAALALLRLLAVPVMAYALLTPVLHPWYILLLLALLPFLTPSGTESARRWLTLAPWLYLSGALVFSYLTYRDPLRFGELEWVRRLEWYPTFALLGLSLAVARMWPVVARKARPPRSDRSVAG